MVSLYIDVVNSMADTVKTPSHHIYRLRIDEIPQTILCFCPCKSPVSLEVMVQVYSVLAKEKKCTIQLSNVKIPDHNTKLMLV